MPKEKTTTKKTGPKKAAGFNLPKPPKRSKVAKSRADAFVDASPRRKRDPGERIAIYLPEPVAHALRIHCAAERRSMTDFATEAVTALLKEKGAL